MGELTANSNLKIIGSVAAFFDQEFRSRNQSMLCTNKNPNAWQPDLKLIEIEDTNQFSADARFATKTDSFNFLAQFHTPGAALWHFPGNNYTFWLKQKTANAPFNVSSKGFPDFALPDKLNSDAGSNSKIICVNQSGAQVPPIEILEGVKLVVDEFSIKDDQINLSLKKLALQHRDNRWTLESYADSGVWLHSPQAALYLDAVGALPLATLSQNYDSSYAVAVNTKLEGEIILMGRTLQVSTRIDADIDLKNLALRLPRHAHLSLTDIQVAALDNGSLPPLELDEISIDYQADPAKFAELIQATQLWWPDTPSADTLLLQIKSKSPIAQLAASINL